MDLKLSFRLFFCVKTASSARRPAGLGNRRTLKIGNSSLLPVLHSVFQKSEFVEFRAVSAYPNGPLILGSTLAPDAVRRYSNRETFAKNCIHYPCLPYTRRMACHQIRLKIFYFVKFPTTGCTFLKFCISEVLNEFML